MNSGKNFTKRAVFARPVKVIAVGFLLTILLGACLLSLPQATLSGKSIGFFDALFTSTSAVCVTGLIVRDTATTFNLFGRVVLISLIQIGGLSFVTFATMLTWLFGKRLSLRTRMLAQESLNEEHAEGLMPMVRWVLVCSFGTEIIGAMLLSVRFIPMYGAIKGIGFSVFHAISAFCNAGFDLFGNFNSLTGFCTDAYVNLIVILLVIIGGFGFLVLDDLIKRARLGRKYRLRLQTKVVCVGYLGLFAFGFVFNLFAEWTNPATLGSLTPPQKVLAALFQSMTLRTAGFNTIDQASLHPATKLVNCLLMFIGAAPGSTGGGVKVTTVAVLFLFLRTALSGRERTRAYGYHISHKLVQRAFTVASVALACILFNITMISLMQPQYDIIDVAYECFSAMGTVGISAIGTPQLNLLSKIGIMLMMYMGRIGPMSFALLLANRQRKGEMDIRYPEGTLMIG